MKAKAYATIIIAGLAFVNAILTAMGKMPIAVDENAIYQTVSYLFAFGTLLVSWYKNQVTSDTNGFLTDVLRKIKSGKLSSEILDEIQTEPKELTNDEVE